MKTISLFFTLVLLTVFNFDSTAQNSGDNDPTFNPTDVGFGFGDGADNTIRTTVIQTDGKIIIGGNFDFYNGISRQSIARLNADGTLDTSFIVGSGANGIIHAIAIQSDGKVVVGGDFTVFNGVSRSYIVRLNPNGSIDNSFAFVNALNGVVLTTTIQTDGKLIIGGMFTSYNGTSRNRIARLNPDGSLDTTFIIGTGVNSKMTTTAMQVDGKIIVGGEFTSYNGTPRNRIARLNTDGSLDTSFVVGTGANYYIYTTSIQADGRILVGGGFTGYNGTSVNRLARLNADGILDTTFNLGTGVNSNVLTITPQLDGKIIVGGEFTSYNGTPKNRIVRLNANGDLDSSFNIGDCAENIINTVSIQNDGKIIIGGDFITYDKLAKNHITRINGDGSIDVFFNISTGANNYIYRTAIQTDGKIIIGGLFTSYNGYFRKFIARLNVDGTLDTNFIVGHGVNYPVQTIAIQTDGKILVGSTYYSDFDDGSTPIYLTRLNIDGSTDSSFNVGSGTNQGVHTLALQSDGKIIIGGNFGSYNGTIIKRMARLNINGTLDNTFNPGAGANSYIFGTLIQDDGKIIINGSFTLYNGVACKYIARLNTNGTLDTGFAQGLGVNSYASAKAIQTDGKIIIGGDFVTYNGNIARLNLDGSIDSSFVIGSGANSAVSTIAIQLDGKIIIGGYFTSYNGISIKRLARLNSDGSLDATFNPGISTNDNIYTTVMQTDGSIILGGNFTSFNGLGRNRITRLLNHCYINASYSFIDNGNGSYSFTNTSIGSFNKNYWAFGDGTTSTMANPNHTFTANGSYVVVLTVNDSTLGSSCRDYYTDTIVVTGVVNPAQCVAGFVMYTDAGEVTVVNSSIGNNLTYLWDFGDGNTSSQAFPTHTYATSDNYYLCLTIDDGAGCVDMYCDSIGENGVVFNKQTGFTINVIAPPIVTGLENVSVINSLVRIYPNPTSTQLTIDTKLAIKEVVIIDITGQIINSVVPKANKIDVSNLSNGIYFIKVVGEEHTIIQKFVKD